MLGATPCNLFDRDQIQLEIADESIACFAQNGGNYASFTAYPAFARQFGNTKYTLSYQGQVIRTGTITVKSRITDLPDLRPDGPQAKLFWSFFDEYESQVVLIQDRLYRMTADGLELIADRVSDFSRASMSGTTKRFIYTDIVLFEDGTVKIGGQDPVMQETGVSLDQAGVELGCCSQRITRCMSAGRMRANTFWIISATAMRTICRIARCM